MSYPKEHYCSNIHDFSYDPHQAICGYPFNDYDRNFMAIESNWYQAFLTDDINKVTCNRCIKAYSNTVTKNPA